MNTIITIGNRIGLAQRDIRVTRNGRFSQSRCQNALTSFVARILDRYSGFTRRWPALNLILTRPSQLVWQQPLRQPLHWQLRPQLALALVKQFPTVSIQPPTAVSLVQNFTTQSSLREPNLPVPPAPLMPAPVPRLNTVGERRRDLIFKHDHLHTKHLAENLILRHREHLVQRLVQRVQRVERVQAQQPAAATASQAAQASSRPLAPAPPVPRIVQRRMVTMPDSRPHASGEAPQAYPAQGSTNGGQPGKYNDMETTDPVINVNNLTDQVIRNIDQRVIAYRERMGKI